ncbi:DUF3949 domain-containing protein [Bacillus massilinigeriensis]|uniref:DUF3949 domain-containing protein n=1 Tax=Bacillus massilionigeriensis TaxID=1805475 RepID=UPI00096AF9D5|nr:DUF3949 domain-containing protein [Bacillus massilionigeriensis]
MHILYWIVGSVIVLYILAMIPLQYQYISEMKELKKKKKQTNEQIIDDMSFEMQQLNFNMQGSFINWPSAIIATFIYKLRHRHD